MAAHQQHAPQRCHVHVVQMMQTFPGCASAQRWGARAIARIIRDDGTQDFAARELGRAGACEAVAAALAAHLAVASVQGAALHAASKLVRESARNWRRFEAAGLCASVVASMRAHALDSGIQLRGACVIVEVLGVTASVGDATGDASEHVVFKDSLTAARADGVLVRALQNHRRDPGTAAAVLHAVESLARAWTGAEALAFCAAGGACAVVACVGAHACDWEVQMQSLSALIMLLDSDVHGSVAVTAKFLAAGAIAAVTAALRAIPLARAEASLALDAVSCLAAHGAAAQLVAAGAAEHVVAAARAYTGADLCDEHPLAGLTSAVGAISQLAESGEHACVRLREAGECEAVPAALASLPLPEDWGGLTAVAHLFCLSSIESLASSGSSVGAGAVDCLARAGACEAVVDTLREFLKQVKGERLVTDTVKAAIDAMIVLTKSSCVAAQLGCAGARSAVASAMAAYPEHEDMQERGTMLKDNLAAAAASRSRK
ncbi:hypothetical protein JKP88DRAFT_302258 [Tribonema minus]|uniref:Inscuteable-like protein n=1 Tax=Tribonema minus TaxID=303371 RepID=A0A835Z964_9STRA|nr:hypothetical protein JKP88DRAFT_302258 [Tribonema minus]